MYLLCQKFCYHLLAVQQYYTEMVLFLVSPFVGMFVCQCNNLISWWNFYGSKMWLKARSSLQMAAFWCTVAWIWWFDISNVL